MACNSEKDFNALKEAAGELLRQNYREHVVKGQRAKTAAVYIHLTPGNEDAPVPELIVERTLADSNKADAVFHINEARRYEKAMAELADTTYEESN